LDIREDFVARSPEIDTHAMTRSEFTGDGNPSDTAVGRANQPTIDAAIELYYADCQGRTRLPPMKRRI